MGMQKWITNYSCIPKIGGGVEHLEKDFAWKGLKLSAIQILIDKNLTERRKK